MYGKGYKIFHIEGGQVNPMWADIVSCFLHVVIVYSAGVLQCWPVKSSIGGHREIEFVIVL